MNNTVRAKTLDFNTELKLKGFNVYKVKSESKVVRNYSRKDFCKICLNTGKNNIHYADRSFETNGSILFFGNPHIPYSWEVVSQTYHGYACLFTEDFLKAGERTESLQHSPFFQLGGTPILNLNKEQRDFIASLFKKMIEEQQTNYQYKDELMRNYIQLIIHEAMKMQPSGNVVQHKNASSRIASLFLELLERQFPIEGLSAPCN